MAKKKKSIFRKFIKYMLIFVVLVYFFTFLFASWDTRTFHHVVYPLYTPKFMMNQFAREARSILFKKLKWYEFFLVTGSSYEHPVELDVWLKSYRESDPAPEKTIEEFEKRVKENGTCVFLSKEASWNFEVRTRTFFNIPYKAFSFGCEYINK